MASASPIVLILGSGPNVGLHVARSFAAKGYKVANASRKAKEEDNTADQINVTSNFSDPTSIPAIFKKVKELLGIPSVVIYNAGAAAFNDPKDPFGIPFGGFVNDFNVNAGSPFAAAQEAVKGFRQLPDSASKTFIFTGNCLNTTIIAQLVSSGSFKSSTAHIIEAAAAAYQDEGFKFYYADERNEDGSPAYTAIDGEAHGKHYLQLAEGKSQGPWQQTFVKGLGYKEFSRK